MKYAFHALPKVKVNSYGLVGHGIWTASNWLAAIYLN